MTDEQKTLYAIEIIRNYLNKDLTDSEIMSKYSIAIVRILENLENNKDSIGVSKITQGSQSVEYVEAQDKILTDDIKKLLPLPYIRLF